jgi:hypothetical protein
MLPRYYLQAMQCLQPNLQQPTDNMYDGYEMTQSISYQVHNFFGTVYFKQAKIYTFEEATQRTRDIS